MPLFGMFFKLHDLKVRLSSEFLISDVSDHYGFVSLVYKVFFYIRDKYKQIIKYMKSSYSVGYFSSDALT